MEQKHIIDQIDAYVLGLLAPEARQAVERHAAECDTCREALQQERELAQLFRTTLHNAAEPDPMRLRQLMPPIPKKREPFWTTLASIGLPRNIQKQFATIAMVAILMIGSLGWQMFAEPESFRVQAASIAETGTTDTPVAVSTGGVALAPTVLAVDSAVGTKPSRMQTSAVTPEPAPLASTPVAE